MAELPAESRAGTDAAPVLVPAWLANLASLSWRLVVIGALGVVLWSIASLLFTVTASIAVAVVVAALFAPLVLRLRAAGRSRTAAAAIVWVCAIGGITGVLLLLGIAFMPYVADLAGRVEAGIAALQTAIAGLQLPDAVGTAIHDVVGALREGSADVAGGLVTASAEVVTVLVLATFLVFFFLRDGDKAWLWTFQALSDQKRETITSAGEEALDRVGGYLRGTSILSGITALTDLVFMLVLGVPLAVPMAILVFFSGYIPYFGGIVTTFLIFIVTYATLGVGPLVVMVVLIAIRNAFLSYWVRPTVYGRTVSIHPAVVLLALPAGMQLAGVIGLFAAVPVIAVVLAVSRAAVAIVTPDPLPDLPGLVPAWLDRMAQWSWRLLAAIALVALVVGIFVTIPLVLIPAVVATILAATLDPVIRWLEGRGRSRGQAAAIAVGGGFLVVVAVLLLAVAVLAQQSAAVGSAAVSGAQSADAAAGGQLGILVSAVRALGRDGIAAIVGIVDAVATLAVIAILSALLAFYFIKDGGRLWRSVVSRARPEVAPGLEAAGARAYEVLGGYMFGTAVISLVGATSQLVIMVVLGIPLALPVFVLSFFLCFIPYVGGFVSTGVALLLTIAVGSSTDIAIMVAWTLVFNIVTGNVVSPLVYGRTVHLHPAVVLVAIPAGAAVAGILGMFIVVPALGVVAVTWRAMVAVMAGQPLPSDPGTDEGAEQDPDPASGVAASAGAVIGPGST